MTQQFSIPVTIRDTVDHKLPLCRGKNKQMLLLRFVAQLGASLKAKPGIAHHDWDHSVRHPWGPKSPQQLVHKFVPSIVEFPLRDAMVHFPGPNDVRMSPFCWLTILRGCPKNCSQSETFSKICCKSLLRKYFWENLASWPHAILVGHLKLATLKPIIIHSLIPINVDLLWKVSKRDAGGMLLLYFTFSHFVCNQQKATHSTFTN